MWVSARIGPQHTRLNVTMSTTPNKYSLQSIETRMLLWDHTREANHMFYLMWALVHSDTYVPQARLMYVGAVRMLTDDDSHDCKLLEEMHLAKSIIYKKTGTAEHEFIYHEVTLDGRPWSPDTAIGVAICQRSPGKGSSMVAHIAGLSIKPTVNTGNVLIKPQGLAPPPVHIPDGSALDSTIEEVVQSKYTPRLQVVTARTHDGWHRSVEERGRPRETSQIVLLLDHGRDRLCLHLLTRSLEYRSTRVLAEYHDRLERGLAKAEIAVFPRSDHNLLPRTRHPEQVPPHTIPMLLVRDPHRPSPQWELARRSIVAGGDLVRDRNLRSSFHRTNRTFGEDQLRPRDERDLAQHAGEAATTGCAGGVSDAPRPGGWLHRSHQPRRDGPQHGCSIAGYIGPHTRDSVIHGRA